MNEKRDLYFEAGAQEVWISASTENGILHTSAFRGFAALPFVPRPIVKLQQGEAPNMSHMEQNSACCEAANAQERGGEGARIPAGRV